MAGAKPTSSESARRGLALVVDDESTSRLILKAQLSRENYQVVVAADGQEALDQYTKHQPDIIFLDVMLPDLYGYEVARRIKIMAGDKFVPIIFLTGLKEDEALAESVEAGGDDFLSKPINFAVLKAKVVAIERIRDLYEKARLQNIELNQLHARMQYEQDIAERILTGAVMAPNVASPPIQSLLRAATTFNGDILISAFTPSGGLSLLLGDFTGHGLAAAIGALPVAETFRSMTATGFALNEVLAEINRKLHRILPTGMFLAAAALRIEPDLRAAVVWNSGLPEVILRGVEGVRRRIRSMHPPMGALSEFLPGCAPELVDLMSGDCFVLCSDGVTEANDGSGEMLGEERFDEILNAHAPQDLFAGICAALEAFVGDAEQADDISLAVVPCCPELFVGAALDESSGHECCPVGSDWYWVLELAGANLATVDPLPLAMNQLQALGIAGRHRQNLYVVIAELFSNALEHGVLGLASAEKGSAEGFLHYYSLRQIALDGLRSGLVRIEMRYQCNGHGGVLVVQVIDSGPGFTQQEPQDGALNTRTCGRGMSLLRSLCQRVSYVGSGNQVEVEYLLGDPL
ncbi:two-component system response regulator HsbR [Uliginosibacterium flavum]